MNLLITIFLASDHSTITYSVTNASHLLQGIGAALRHSELVDSEIMCVSVTNNGEEQVSELNKRRNNSSVRRLEL